MKQIPGYPRYAIDEDGNVYSATWDKHRQLKPVIHKQKGYHMYALTAVSGKGNAKYEYAHRLMWMTYCGEIPDGYHINHLDGVVTNNHLSNLECINPRGNAAHYQNILIPKAMQGMECPHCGKSVWQKETPRS